MTTPKPFLSFYRTFFDPLHARNRRINGEIIPLISIDITDGEVPSALLCAGYTVLPPDIYDFTYRDERYCLFSSLSNADTEDIGFITNILFEGGYPLDLHTIRLPSMVLFPDGDLFLGEKFYGCEKWVELMADQLLRFVEGEHTFEAIYKRITNPPDGIPGIKPL